MDDAERVRFRERFGGLQGELAGPRNRQRAALLEQLAEIESLEELHHHVRDAVEQARVGDTRDVLAL